MPAAPDRDELRRLHFVNALFAHLTGHDLYLAEQIRSAIAFSLGELEAQMREHLEYAARYDAAFTAAAASTRPSPKYLSQPGAPRSTAVSYNSC